MQGPSNRWDAALYDRSYSFVWRLGEELIDLLAPRPGERVLDLGCGTGHLTARIAARGADVIGVDNAPDMIERAQHTYPDTSFVIGDGTQLAYREEFEAVFSNAALHWMRPPDAVVQGVWTALRPGGRFVAEMGGKGNVGAIMEGVQRVLAEANAPASARELRYYPSIADYASLLERAGFSVTSATLFDRPTLLDGGPDGLRNWLAMFGANLLSWASDDERQRLVRRIEDVTRPRLFRDGAWTADYRRLRFVALKP